MIKFIYFDLGGVAIKDFSGSEDKWSELKKELGIGLDKDEKYRIFWSKYEKDLCLGKKNTNDVLTLMKKELGIKAPESYNLLIDGFVNRFEKNTSIWPVIEKIRKACGVGLLTNAYPGMLDAVKNCGILPEINWNVIVDSSVVGFGKPDSEIFKLSEEKCGFKSKEILFIDNSEKNISSAKNFGWQVFFYDSSDCDKSSKELGRYLMEK